ncbi:MAG: type II secretion system F family protein [Vicinamibacterales bacterium]
MEWQIIALFVLLFVAVATAMMALLWPLADASPARRRLSEVTGGARPRPAAVESVLGDAPSALASRVRTLVPYSPATMQRLQKQLSGAGIAGDWPPLLFSGAQLVLPPLVLAAGLVFYGRSGQPLALSILAALLAFYLPHLWLERQIERRRTEIRNGLPDAIDLLIVCIEAGSGIDQALMRVSEELHIAYPTLAAELEHITAEMRAGKPRIEAFKNFATRTGVDDVRSLVAMLVQTDRFGTSLGQALRTHADTSRTKRRQRAEERAAKLGIKLLFPLVFCLFPAFYLVVLGPSLLRIFRQLVWGPLAR